MQLDQTRIVVRERGLLDIFDLSLQVVRMFARPLTFAVAAVAVPMMLLNYGLIGWLVADDSEMTVPRYVWLMIQLVFLEAPLVSVPVTLFLGRAMFLQPATAKELLREVYRHFWRLLFCLGILRGVVPAMLLALAIERYAEMSASEVFLPMVAFGAILIRALRPFVTEIVLLERNPLSSRDRRVLTVGRRSAALHNPSTGDLFGRWIGGSLIAVLMAVSVLFTLWFLTGITLNDWSWGPVMLYVFFPLSMWIVAGYFGVVRFLSYLDLRIRREGWEVELRMRAAAARLKGQMT